MFYSNKKTKLIWTLSIAVFVFSIASTARAAYLTGPQGPWTSGTGSIYYNDGNVGVGMTGTPGAKLEVRHNGASTYGVGILLKQDAIGNSDGPRIEYYKTMTTPKSWTTGILNGVDVDDFAISENGDTVAGFGTPRLTVQAGGNVGIGTTTPSSKLHISGSGVTTMNLETSDIFSTPPSVMINAVLKYNSGGATTNMGRIVFAKNNALDADTGAYTAFYKKPHGSTIAEAMRIDPDGNIGIGTTAPGAYKLNVNGSTYVNGAVYLKGTNSYIDSDGNSLYLKGTGSTYLNTANTAYVTVAGGAIFNGGNVGIGTTAPTRKLQVSGQGVFTTSSEIVDGGTVSPSLRIGYLTSGDYGYIQAIESSQHVEKLILQPVGGNVGIGTTNPAQKLELNGTLSFYNNNSGQANSLIGSIKADNNYDFNHITRADTAGAASINFYSGPTWYTGEIAFNTNSSDSTFVLPTERMRINAAGNVGINVTNPTTKLSVSGGANDVVNVGGGQVAGLNSTQTNPDHAVSLAYLQANYLPGSSSKWTDGASGSIYRNSNVGIGTNAPVAKLDVAGGIHTDSVYERINSFATRIAYPKGGYYFTTASSVTGAIAIALPTKVSDTMISFWVDIYDYSDNTTLSVFVSGYPYATAGVWSNTSALVLGSNSNKNLTVRFGGSNDNTRSIVYIGEASTVWNYPQITVRDVTAGYSTSVAEMDNLPWGVTIETTLLNVNRTRSNNFPYSDWNRIINLPSGTTNYVTKWTGTNTQGNSIIYDNGTNVGIGTAGPQAKVTLQDGEILFKESGSVHGMTSYFYQNTVGTMGRANTTTGGMHIWGVASSDAVGLTLRGVIGSATPSASTSATKFISYKQNGTSIGNLGNTDMAFQFLNNSAALISVLGSGNVGINVTNPTTKLSVSGGANDVVNVGGGQVAGLNSTQTNPDHAVSLAYLQANYLPGSSSKWTDGASGSIYRNSNVGIGTTNPTSKLTINGGTTEIRSGGILMLRNAANDYDFDIQQVGYTLQFGSASMSNVAMTYDTTGKVGIGTAAPENKLDVVGKLGVGSSPTSSYNEGILIRNNASENTSLMLWQNGVASGKIGFPASNNNLRIVNTYTDGSINNAAAIDIATTGNVGIGTTAPNAKLEVSGSTTPGIFVTSTNYPTTYRTQLGAQAGAQGILVLGNNGANEIRFGTSAVGGAGSIYVNNTADYSAAVNGTLAMHFTSTGNVGIGTITPGAKLDVNGTVRATAYIYSSDRNLKRNIRTLDNSLEKILSLRGVSFNWKENGDSSVGLIAQEVQKVYPELVSGEIGNQGVQYGNLVAPLIEAVKAQQREIEALQIRMEALELNNKGK